MIELEAISRYPDICVREFGRYSAAHDPGNNTHLVKIIFIIDSLQRHGAQRFLTHLARGLGDLGYEQTVIALNDPSAPDIKEALVGAGCEIKRIGKCSLLLGGAGWWRLAGILKRAKPNVVVTMLDFADTLGRPAARLAGCRTLVSSIRVRNLAKPSWQRWLDRKSVGWADKVIVNTRELVAYVCEKEGVRREQVVVIPNGVEDLRARSAGLRDQYRQQIGLAPDTIVLGWVGRLQAQKNIGLLLQACARLPANSRPWKVLVLGDGPERERFSVQADKLRLNDRLIWLGERDDVEGWLAAMDIFVHTANFEGMPNVVMEAMAMGLAVVASGVDGTRELIEDGVSGYLVAPGDAAGFAGRIAGLMREPGLASRLGERAHRDILERFDMPRMIRAHDALFRSLVKAGNT
jgi:glycosyltransferase involved in cell wall biosynthesis